MNRSNSERYEISNPERGIIGHATSKEEAVNIAQNWIEKEKLPAVIRDSKARKNKPSLFDVRICTGEAHSNPWIDNCGVCMPYWGVTVRARQG